MRTAAENVFESPGVSHLDRTPPRRVDERDHLLLDTAKVLFVEWGYAQVSMELIARSAGVAARTIYRNFGGKHGVLCKVIERECERQTACAAMFDRPCQDIDSMLSDIGGHVIHQALSPVLRSLHADALAAREFELAQKIDPVQCGPWRPVLEGIFASAAWRAHYWPAPQADLLCDMFLGCVLGSHARASKSALGDEISETGLKAMARAATRRFLAAVPSRGRTGSRPCYLAAALAQAALAGDDHESMSGAH